jgi:hypothetical protein
MSNSLAISPLQRGFSTKRIHPQYMMALVKRKTYWNIGVFIWQLVSGIDRAISSQPHSVKEESDYQREHELQSFDGQCISDRVGKQRK